jgi:hypothetical protein
MKSFYISQNIDISKPCGKGNQENYQHGGKKAGSREVSVLNYTQRINQIIGTISLLWKRALKRSREE